MRSHACNAALYSEQTSSWGQREQAEAKYGACRPSTIILRTLHTSDTTVETDLPSAMYSIRSSKMLACAAGAPSFNVSCTVACGAFLLLLAIAAADYQFSNSWFDGATRPNSQHGRPSCQS